MNERRLLLEIFDAALRAVDGARCVAHFLRHRPILGPVEIFAIGKAASAMTRGAREILGDGISRALVITKDGHADAELARAANVTILESAHPLPDARSLAAGEELHRRVRGLAAGTFPLFLISGGSSSLVERLREGITLDDLRALNAWGLSDGWDIARLNAERARLSTLKAGGIAHLLAHREGLALFLSDVPGDDPDVIGSGLLGHADDGADAIGRHIVASVDVGVRAAVDAGAARGLVLRGGERRFDGNAVDVAREFVDALRECPGDGIVWGGESTVRLPARHGRGGRNTHLGLVAAAALRAGEELFVLAGASDGTDGPTDDAGALVDAGTIERAELGGCDVARALEEFDSSLALEAAGDLLHTGPTGTNVGDLLLGLKGSRRV